MTYTFARIKVHPKLDLTAWYLVIPASAIDLTMDMHKSASIAMFQKFFLNPHVFDQKSGAPKYEGGEAYHPIKLAAGWIETAMKGLSRYGVVYMNKVHGMWFGETVQVLETREAEKLGDWPKDADANVVKIVISRWAAGQHYYLTANNGQVFSQPKFDTYEQAMAEARKHAIEQNISFAPADHLYTREGD
jgi:hypothetical protein